MKFSRYLIILMCAWAIGACTSKNDYGKDYDMDFPVPVISSVTEDVHVGEPISIKGTGFSSPNVVTLDGQVLKVMEESATEIKVVSPRIFNAAPVVVHNVYRMQNMEPSALVHPIYPSMEDIVVDQWPAKIIRGRAVVIRGKNVDLITEVTLGATVIKVNGLTQSPDQLVVTAPSSLAESKLQVQVKTMYGNSLQSPLLDVEDPSPIFVPVAPIVLLDFEDGVTHFTKGVLPDADFTAQINRQGIAPARGANFFSFYANNIASNWDNLGFITLKFDKPISLAEFNDAHISFLYNSDDNVGNFQVKVVQDGKTAGSYFANGVTGNPLDAWMLRPTAGQWQWVSARLKDLLTEDWGGGFTKFNPNGNIEEVELIIKSVNAGYWDGKTSAGGVFVNKKLKVNIDQVMITDGPVHPIYLLNDFESGTSNFVTEPADGIAADVAKISNEPVHTISGNKYFSVVKNNSVGWKWMGTLEFKKGYDFSTIADPYLCFFANTNGQQANLQFKFVQNGVAYGTSINTADWMFKTKGWEMKQLQLKEMQWDNWSGTSAKINFNTPFEELTIGFSTGNVGNDPNNPMKYELHIDDIYISDGAMF